ncbi:hypothetical protein [Haliscomenobacter sp.]|uniref:hypothetical protein n=1 Tax=Haliscomenobacter sp. TaxID=2717303 RepID=UPI0035942D3A
MQNKGFQGSKVPGVPGFGGLDFGTLPLTSGIDDLGRQKGTTVIVQAERVSGTSRETSVEIR